MKTESEVLNSLARYCSQAERCVFDLHRKIREAELPEDAETRIIERLVEEKFVDDARYARSFVNDKYRFNHWGRIKIVYELKIRNISPELYTEAINLINEDEYMAILEELLRSKKRAVKGRDGRDIFAKLLRFASSRGYEPSLIISTLKKILKDIDYEEDD
ncbi:MAG: RecX family transcriptional regulator [Tannerella sp.]|jgi:regulatory protein|nr:RecX family transcriptional regulator [Tannerella sp.]